jgi:hypothetical protein
LLASFGQTSLREELGSLTEAKILVEEWESSGPFHVKK